MFRDSIFSANLKLQKSFKDVPQVLDVAQDFKNRVEDFKPYIPLIQGLRNQGMRIRHWDQLSEDIGFNIQPKKDLTFQKCLDMKLQGMSQKFSFLYVKQCIFVSEIIYHEDLEKRESLRRGRGVVAHKRHERPV